DIESLRVLSGLPRWGVEIEAGMLVSESTLYETAVSYDKGCFLGQETVAKIRSGRGPARFPTLLVLEDGIEDADELVGEDLVINDRKIGHVLSVANWQGETILQALLGRDHRVEGTHLRCETADGIVISATVEPVPWISDWDASACARELHNRASESFVSGDEERAMELMRRSVAVCPEFADGYESLGVMLGRQGDYAQAIEMMEKLLEIEPDSIMAHSNMSLYFNLLGRIEDAEREAAKATLAGFRQSQPTAGTDTIQIDKGGDRAAEHEQRAELFRQVLEVDPDDAMANCELGEIELNQGRFNEAIELLRRALDGDECYSSAYLALGQAHESLSEEEEARRIYEQGIKIAAKKGDMATANKMQARLSAL
ncbi:MAG: tetratricopeptide repeat protein, partial [bacterium]|nr:tetratricopeptide repeat protein [bacterium]